MTKTHLFIFLVLILSSCTNSSNSEKELELKERELNLREREQSLNNSTYNSDDQTSSIEVTENTNSKKPNLTASEIRDNLMLSEKENPIEFLSVEYSLTYKVLSGEDKIKGTIFNTATLATFKDVVLTISYLSETNSQLKKQEFTVYDYVYPGNSTSFTIKTISPKNTKKIGVTIKSAKSN